MSEVANKRSAAQAGIDWVAKHWPRVRLAHEGVMLDRVQRVQRIGEVIARNTMTGKSDDADGWPDYEGERAMAVDIGDTIHHHYPAPVERPPEPAPPPPKQPGNLTKAALAAALAALLGGGGYLLGNGGKTTPEVSPPAVEIPASPDTTRRVDVGVYRPGK